jgi:hypothetical protein
MVAASTSVAAGAASAGFTVTTVPTCVSAIATISATYAGVTKSSVLTVTSTTMDTVTLQRAEYVRGRNLLRTWATSSAPTATLQVFVTSSAELIGTMSNLGAGSYSGQFAWPVNPQNITIRSSSCGTATRDLAK